MYSELMFGFHLKLILYFYCIGDGDETHATCAFGCVFCPCVYFLKRFSKLPGILRIFGFSRSNLKVQSQRRAK